MKKLLTWWLVAAGGVMAQPLANRVLVVYNSNPSALTDSLVVADYYMAARGIPATNKCGIAFSSTEQITMAEWLTTYRNSFRSCLDQPGVGRANILYVVLSYNTPFTLVQPSPYYTAAVDSHVADVWDAYSTSYFSGVPAAPHRYFSNAQSAGNVYPAFKTLAAMRAEARAPLLYSVWRLDGSTPVAAKALVDRAKAAEAQPGGLAGGGGTVYVDRRFGPDLTLGAGDNDYLSGDIDLQRMGTMSSTTGLAVVEDSNFEEIGVAPAPLTAPDAMMYCGWYELLSYHPVFTWKTGAIGWHLDSASATSPRSGNSWAAKALEQGITVTSGSVNEPYLEGLVHPDIVTRHLLQGGNVGDAFLRGTAWLKWMIMNIGDPLYVPFPGGRPPFSSPSYTEDTLSVSATSTVTNSVTVTLTTKDPAPPGGRVINWQNGYYPAYVERLPLTTTISEGGRTSTVVLNVTNPVSNPEEYIAVRIYATYDSKLSRNSVLMTSLLGKPYAASTSFRAGATTQGAVVLNTPAPANTVVNLTSSHPGVVQVPASVVVRWGARVALFNYTSTPGSVSTSTPVTITATTGSYLSRTGLTITP